MRFTCWLLYRLAPSWLFCLPDRPSQAFSLNHRFKVMCCLGIFCVIDEYFSLVEFLVHSWRQHWWGILLWKQSWCSCSLSSSSPFGLASRVLISSLLAQFKVVGKEDRVPTLDHWLLIAYQGGTLRPPAFLFFNSQWFIHELSIPSYCLRLVDELASQRVHFEVHIAHELPQHL